jgi:hypothetical protein
MMPVAHKPIVKTRNQRLGTLKYVNLIQNKHKYLTFSATEQFRRPFFSVRFLQSNISSKYYFQVFQFSLLH